MLTNESMHIHESSSLLVIGAHPDDVKCFTGVMLRSIGKCAKVFSVCVTNGERLNRKNPSLIPYEEATQMGERRKREHIEFLLELGLPRENIILLGFANGCLPPIRDDFWRSDDEPYFAPLLQADHVVDKDAYRLGTPFCGEAFLALLKEIIVNLNPTHILSHHPKDWADEHRAMAFFANKAASELVAEGRLQRRPRTYASLIYLTHVQWPPAGESFLSPELKKLSFGAGAIQFQLSREELQRKREACKIFEPTLAEVLGEDYFPSYMKNDELYWKL